MAENQFVPFATGGTANVQDLTEYTADGMTQSGNVSGIASSARNNRALRQGTFVAAAMGQVAADYSGLDSLDDGNLAEFVANFETAIKALVGTVTRTKLTSALTIYVSTAGSDTNDGFTPSTPYRHIQTAVNYMERNIDSNGQGLAISIAAGTYNESITCRGSIIGGGLIYFVTTGGTVTISGSGFCFGVGSGASIFIGGDFQLNTSHLANSPDSAIVVDTGGSVTIDKSSSGGEIKFGAAPLGHIYASANGFITNPSTGSSYTINGSAGHHIIAGGGQAVLQAETVTILGGPSFTSFVWSADGGIVDVGSNTYLGSALGSRFSVSHNSTINTGGAGPSYLPGNAPGTADTATGGYYV